MTPNASKALAEALAFLQGLGDAAEPDVAAAIFAEQLARAGYSVQPIAAPVLCDLAPATLRKVRDALALTATQVAIEAGLAMETVARAEKEGSRSIPSTTEAIAGALVRLGARRPG